MVATPLSRHAKTLDFDLECHNNCADSVCRNTVVQRRFEVVQLVAYYAGSKKPNTGDRP